MSTVQTSTQYQTDLKMRRMFGQIATGMQQIEKQIGDLLELAAGMRTTLGATMLTLAQVEKLYVDNCESRRKADELLHEAQTRLADLTANTSAKLAEGAATAKEFGDKLSGTQKQADRIANDRFIKDDAKGPPLPGVKYVGLDHFRVALNLDRTAISKLRDDGRIPEHDAEEVGAGRPKHLWTRHRADKIVRCLMNDQTAKKGIAAPI